MKTGLILYAYLAILFFSGITASGSSFPIKIKDDLGREIEIADVPKQIVSMAPSNTELLFALGLKDKIVGRTEHCSCPAEIKKKQAIGGFASPDIDKIVALKPDIILSLGTVQKSAVEQLEKRGQKVFWIYPRNVQEILNSFERIGKITGAEKAGRKLKEKVEKKIRDIQNRIGTIPEEKRLSVFRVMGFDPPATIGKENFQTDVFYMAGGRNVFADTKKDYFQMKLDTLIRHNPDVIIICGKEPERAKQRVLQRKGWEVLKAVKENRILCISCDLICRPGPKIAETIGIIADYLLEFHKQHKNGNF
jgi:iron complex transport system substrate-binding protein